MNLTPILNWITHNPSLILAYVGGAGGLSVTLEAILTKFHISSKKIAFTLLHVLAIISAVVAWYMGASGQTIVGSYAALTIVAQVWHRFVISGLSQKYIMPFLEYLATQRATVTTVHTTTPSVVATPTAASIAPFTVSSANTTVSPDVAATVK